MKKLFKIGCFGIIGAVLVIIIIGYFVGKQKDSQKERVYHLGSDELFAESIDCNKDYEDGNYSIRYQDLRKKLHGLYVVKTRTHQFMFEKNMNEFLVIPVLADGKTDSKKRLVYFNNSETGEIRRGLIYKLENEAGEKAVFTLQYDSTTNPEQLLIAKFINDSTQACARGLLFNVLE